MARPALLAPAFTLWGSPVTLLEVVAFVLGIAMVLCNLRVHPLAWPLAMASSALYGVLFLHSRLYGEAGLQLLFIALAALGLTAPLFGERPTAPAPKAEAPAHRPIWVLLAGGTTISTKCCSTTPATSSAAMASTPNSRLAAPRVSSNRRLLPGWS